jgi:predicted ribosome quality control (RQC) complex YloA/Tae2 family protein
MSFGPELVWLCCMDLKGLEGKAVRRVDGGDGWVALTMSNKEVLLLSWKAQNCGAARISESEKRDLASMSTLTPPVVNALKKNIKDAELVLVEQVRRDRILRFSFRKTVGAGFSSVSHVVLEAMDRYANLILTDENGVVLETARHVHPEENRFRSVLPAQPYVMPPAFEGQPLEELLARPALEGLIRTAGFGRPLLEAVSNLGANEARRFLACFYGEAVPEEMVFQKLGRYVTAFPVQLRGAEIIDGARARDVWRDITIISMLGASLASRRKALCDRIAREIKRRERQRDDIMRLLSEEDPDKYRHWGEIVVSNRHQIKPGASDAEIEFWDETGTLKKETVRLDPSKTPARNADMFFARYRKISAAQQRASVLLDKVDSELRELDELLAIASASRGDFELSSIESELGIGKKRPVPGGAKKTAEHLPPHRRFDLGFALVFVGLSSKGNRYVTFRLATPDDLWFHAQGVPGSHVVLRYTAAPSPEEEDKAVMFCASLAAHYSKGGGDDARRVDYALRKHVSPIKGKEAGVTYRNFKSIMADPRCWRSFDERQA